MVAPEGYRVSEVGVIPEDWDVKCLGDLFDITSSKRVFQNEWKDSGVPFLRARELAVLGEKGRVENELFISEEMYERYVAQYGAVSADDVLITGVGTLGKVYVVREKDRFYFKDGNIIWLKSRGLVNPYYLKQLYYTPLLVGQVIGSSAGTTVGTYTITSAKETIIPYPELREQTAIAQALSNADALSASLERLIAKKRHVKQGAMQELLTGKTRLPGFCGEWQIVNLADNSFLKARIGWQGLTKAEYLNSGYAYLVTGTDFCDGVIDFSGCAHVNKSRYDQDEHIQIKDGDILVTKDGTIGKVAMVKRLHKKATLNSGIFVVRPLTDKSYHGPFVYHVLCSQVFTDFLNKLSAGSTIEHLYEKDFTGFEFAVPPAIDEQIAIAGILSDMDDEVEQLQKKLKKCKHIKQGMMQELLTGRIRLPQEGTKE